MRHAAPTPRAALPEKAAFYVELYLENTHNCMMINKLMRAAAATLAVLLLGLPCALGGAAADAAGERFTLRAIAEVEVPSLESGHERIKLVPADRVVPGDEIVYTVEIRNPGAMALPPPRVDYPIPEHTRYVADSATGPGAEVSFSVDGGRTFDRPERLMVAGGDGRARAATPADYTHIRWQLKHILKGNAVAFARFRVVVK